MIKQTHLSQTKANKKLASSRCLKASSREALESELWESLNKLEHRAEILIAISHNQRKSGCYELAKAYKKQAIEAKSRAQSIRKLLGDAT